MIIGDWMASIYGIGGDRGDYHLFLDHNGRFERVVRSESREPQRDSGRWEYDEEERLLSLHYDAPDPWNRTSSHWRVLSVSGCEDSNVLLVLREAVLASRNLPLLFYRVHGAGRAYGTDWQKRLDASNG